MGDNQGTASFESLDTPNGRGINSMDQPTPPAGLEALAPSPAAHQDDAALPPHTADMGAAAPSPVFDAVVAPDPAGTSHLAMEAEIQALKAKFEKWEKEAKRAEEADKKSNKRYKREAIRAVEKVRKLQATNSGYMDSMGAKLEALNTELEYIEDYEQMLVEIGDEKELLEEKVAELEDELEELRIAVMKQGKEPSAGETQTREKKGGADDLQTDIVKPQLNRVSWTKFKALRLQGSDVVISAIDVLEGDPVITYSDTFKIPAWNLRWSGINTSQLDVDEEDMDGNQGRTPKRVSDPGRSPVPERIRIHSLHIIRILEAIHGEKMSVVGRDSLVMIRPYKALVHYRPQILDKFKQLQSSFGDGIWNESDSDTAHTSNDAAAPNNFNPDETKAQPEDDEYTFSKTAYIHLRCLVEFLDTEIEARLQYLASDQCQKVTFHDIWYLFKPGDEIVGQARQQAYRIINITSTGHKVRVPFRVWGRNSTEKSTEASVTLHCAYVDFDGKELGPVVRSFTIENFDGEKAVTSLEAYPLRFAGGGTLYAGLPAPGRLSFREQLVARGKMFLDVAGVKHMHYNGFTLETRDEVDSQVMVDFVEAFAATSVDTTGWQPNVASLIDMNFGADEKEKAKNSKDEICTASCCKDDTVHVDEYAEKKRNEDYIGSLMPQDPTAEPSVAIYPRALRDTRSPENALRDDDLVIMCYRVYGFVLRSRKWGMDNFLPWKLQVRVFNANKYV